MKILKKIGTFFSSVSELIKRGFAKVSLFFRTTKLFNFFRTTLFKQIILGLLCLVALFQIVLMVLVYGFKSEDKFTRFGAGIIPLPVAIVNQDVITYNEYLKEKDYIHHFYGATKQQGIDYSTIDKQILDQLVENKLLAFQSFRYKEKVSKSDVNTALDGIVKQNGGEAQVTKVLEELYGLNLNDFRNLVKTQLIREKLSSDLIEKVKVRHILVKVDSKATDDQVAAAKTKITGYLDEINKGLDFGEAAKKYSDDTGSASDGGSLDAFGPGEMVQQFSDVAFSTPVGKVSQPFRTEYGWHILKVESKTGKIKMSFDDWLSLLKKHSLIVKFI